MRSCSWRLGALLLPFLVSVANAGPALEGNCAVFLVEAGKIVPGKKEWQATFDRLVYSFPSDKELKLFQANPAKYAPVLAGDCVVCRVEMGARVPGKAEFHHKHNGRLYVFPSAKQRDMFKADPNKYSAADVALDRRCPVCLLDMKKLVTGKDEISSTYDGLRYFFPETPMMKLFDANPAKYVPALDGHCSICFKDAKKLMPGKSDFALIHRGRAYLQADASTQKKFMANPAAYENLDLANKGNCIVCEKMMAKQIPGTMEHVSVYKGKLYLFPEKKARDMFDADPAKYVALDAKGADASPAPKLLAVSGRTACAACEFGVRPLTDSGSLGLAVVSSGKIFVVDRAEQLYPSLYADRFGGLNVELQGTVQRQDGNVVWIAPTSLNIKK